MATLALNLNDILYQGGPVALVELDFPADTDVSDVFTGLAGAGDLLIRLEQRSTNHNTTAPVMTVTVEHSADGDSWDTLGAFDELTGDADAYLRVANPLDQIRFSYAVTHPGRIHKIAILVLPRPVSDPTGASDGDLLTAGGGGYAWVTPA